MTGGAGRVYLDWNATAPLRPEAREAMLSAMDVAGNPSSVHAEGRAARALVENARADVAALVGCKPGEVVFTSGATEAARVLATVPSQYDVLVEPTAHDAVWAHVRMSNWTEQPEGPGHTLAMGLANSETGVITDPPEKVDGKYPFGAARADSLFLDVTQAVGRIPWSFAWSGAALACLSRAQARRPEGRGRVWSSAMAWTSPRSSRAAGRNWGEDPARRTSWASLVSGQRPALRCAISTPVSGPRWRNLEIF